MSVLHQVVTHRELGLLYLLKDRDNVNRLLTLEAKPEVLRAVLLSAFEQLAKEKDVHFRPAQAQLRGNPLARTATGEPVSPEFSYQEWLIWFSGQRKLKPKKPKKIVVPKNKPALPASHSPHPRIPPEILLPSPAAPKGFRVITVNGQYFIERIE